MIERLLYAKKYAINDNIVLKIPTIGEILDRGDEYYYLLDMFTAMPIDYMVQLDDNHIDFTQIDEWKLFLLLFNGAREINIDSSLFFDGIKLADFQIAGDMSTLSDELVIIDPIRDIVINRDIYRLISDAVCKIHGREKDMRKPANKEAKTYMIEVERRKMKRRKKQKERSVMEDMIVALVNTPEFKYDFKTVRDLTIYQFNESVKQVLKKVSVDYRMFGVYSGTVDATKMNKDELNWLVR